MKKLVLAILATATLLTACSNTVNGVGKDVEKAGEKIQKTVQ